MGKNLKLKSVMVLKEYTVESLAKEIGITKASLSRKINGKRAFTEIEIGKICLVLERKPEELFFSNKLPIEEKKTVNA